MMGLQGHEKNMKASSPLLAILLARKQYITMAMLSRGPQIQRIGGRRPWIIVRKYRCHRCMDEAAWRARFASEVGSLECEEGAVEK